MQNVRNAPVHGIRLASLPHQRGLSENANKVLHIGCVTYNPHHDQSNFILHGLFNDGGPDVSSEYSLVDGGIHDFCFDSSAVAFAHTADKAAVSFLNLETHVITQQRTCSNWSDSDPLCIQYRNKKGNKQLLLGHRDGNMSLIDTRSTATQTTSETCSNFGSVSSIQQLTNKEHLIITKGSFGTCQIFDTRRLGKKSSLLKLQPSSDVHCTKSVKCTGLAVDPSESVVLSPYASQQNDIMMALWSIDSGKLLRTIKLENEDSNVGEGCPLFCELKSEITGGFKMRCINQSTPVITRSSWGVWYKSRSASSNLPPGAGGIHHICFE